MHDPTCTNRNLKQSSASRVSQGEVESQEEVLAAAGDRQLQGEVALGRASGPAESNGAALHACMPTRRVTGCRERRGVGRERSWARARGVLHCSAARVRRSVEPCECTRTAHVRRRQRGEERGVRRARVGESHAPARHCCSSASTSPAPPGSFRRTRHSLTQSDYTPCAHPNSPLRRAMPPSPLRTLASRLFAAAALSVLLACIRRVVARIMLRGAGDSRRRAQRALASPVRRGSLRRVEGGRARERDWAVGRGARPVRAAPANRHDCPKRAS